MVLKVKYIDLVIWISLLFLLIVDMLNGVLHTHEIHLGVSVSQFYKLAVVCLFFLRLVVIPRYLIYIVSVFGILILPSLFSLVLDRIGMFGFMQDVVKSFKYLIILISFYYFKMVFMTSSKEFLMHYIFWIKWSFVVLTINLLVKFIGLGNPMYDVGNIGSKGYFIAGNEVSALLLVLSGFLSYYYLVIRNNLKAYLLYGLGSIVLGFLISSKTGILGVFLIHLLVLWSSGKIRLNTPKQRRIFRVIILGIGLMIIGIFLFIRNSAVFMRYTYFWDKLDVTTFILSSRNIYFNEMMVVYDAHYTFLDKIIGVGDRYYHILAGKLIEIDGLDLFFSNGFLGLAVFVILLSLLFLQLKRNLHIPHFLFAHLSMIMFVMLCLLSCLSGHIFNSGLAGIFIGFVFALGFKTCLWKKS